MARNYVENLSEEVKKGMHEKASQGHWPTVAPIAYNNTRNSGGITPDPVMAPLVRELFERAATGNFSIDDRTTHAKTIGLRTRNNHPVAKSKIARLLQHDAYTGRFTWGGKTYQGVYEPLITANLFAAVQDVISGRRHPRMQRHAFTYSGLLRCATCNGMLSGDLKKGRYTYYGCKGSKGCKRYYPETLFENETKRVLSLPRLDQDISEWLISEIGLVRRASNQASRSRGAQRRAHHRTPTPPGPRVRRQAARHDHRNHLAGASRALANRDRRSRPTRETAASREEFTKRIKTPFELAQSALAQYVTRNTKEREELLKTLDSNYTVKDRSITVSVGSPFDALLRATETCDWLGDRESNPD